MLMNTTFLGDSFSIKWQSRGAELAADIYKEWKIVLNYERK